MGHLMVIHVLGFLAIQPRREQTAEPFNTQAFMESRTP